MMWLKLINILITKKMKEVVSKFYYLLLLSTIIYTIKYLFLNNNNIINYFPLFTFMFIVNIVICVYCEHIQAGPEPCSTSVDCATQGCV
jgi:hypothetical protein